MALRYYPVIQFLDDLGNVLAGGLINTYITGTTTNKATYQDQAQATAHANPIVLDSDGRPPGGAIWLLDDAEYTLAIKDSDSVTLQTVNDVSGIVTPLSGDTQFEGIIFANGKGISDSNSNEQLLFSETSSAVNYVNITNAAAGSGVTVGAAGDDTNIDLLLTSKGSGVVKINGDTISGSYAAKVGLVTSNGTDSDHDIDIAAGSISDSTNAVLMTLAAMTKRIDANWSAGTGNGGLPTAVSLTNNTTYHIFAIEDGSGTVDAGFDTSVTATNLLSESSYTRYARIGSVITDGSANILGYTQVGDTFLLDAPVQDEANNNPGTSAVADALTVPLGIKVEADVVFSVVDVTSAATLYALLTSPDQTDTTPSVSMFTMVIPTTADATAASAGNVRARVLTNTSSQVRYRLSASDTDTTAYINTMGWRDFI